MGGGMTAAEKKKMIMEMQDLMRQIVDLDKNLSEENTKQTNLKSPGSSDGVWGGNTDESYKSILVEYNKGKLAPKDMDEALLFLNKVKVSLSADKEKEVAKDQGPTTPQPKPASAITDDQAKAAFRGLLESIQSGRIKLKAGSNTNEFRQRIGRDWGAIIRVYKGPQGVVDAFYGGLALTEPEKAQLVNINEIGFDGTSTVVGKINQKFLEAINTYIKPFGRALRTEKGMARVFDRRQERQERKQNRANAALKDLWILSKVAQRKEVAREQLIKAADDTFSGGIIDGVLEGTTKVTDLAEITTLFGSGSKLNAAIYAVKKMLINKPDFIGYKDFIKSIQSHDFDSAADAFKEVVGVSLSDWVSRNDGENREKYSKAVSSVGADDSFNFGPALKFYFLKLKDFNKRILESWNKTDDKKQTQARRPVSTKSSVSNLDNLRNLLIKAGYHPAEGSGWAPLDVPFRRATEEFANLKNIKLNSPWNWGSVSESLFGMTPDIYGAEKLVSELVAMKPSGQQADSSQPSVAPAPTAAAPTDSNKVVEGLRFLFDKILSGEVKVDKAGPDFRRDSKNFRGIIGGLGGTNGAALYCVERCGFTSEENKQIVNYPNLDITTLGGKVDRSSVLGKIYNQFMLLMREARSGFGKDNRGITEEQLNRSVSRVIRERASESKKAASISKSIEIRKMAARKKLGLQS